MNVIKEYLKQARDQNPMSRDQYRWDSAALYTISGMVSVWVDDAGYTKTEKKINALEVMERLKLLHAAFEENDKIGLVLSYKLYLSFGVVENEFSSLNKKFFCLKYSNG